MLNLFLYAALCVESRVLSVVVWVLCLLFFVFHLPASFYFFLLSSALGLLQCVTNQCSWFSLGADATEQQKWNHRKSFGSLNSSCVLNTSLKYTKWGMLGIRQLYNILVQFQSAYIISNTFYSISQINFNIKNKINYIKLQLSLLACANNLCRVSKMLHTRLSMTLLIFMCPSLVWQGRASGQVGGALSSATFICSFQWASQAFQLLSVLSKNRWCREQKKWEMKRRERF